MRKFNPFLLVLVLISIFAVNVAFGAPNAPTGLTVTDTKVNIMDAGWTDGGGDPTDHYRIEYKATGTSTWYTLTSTATNVSISAAPGTYEVRVYAVDASNNDSPASSSVTGKALAGGGGGGGSTTPARIIRKGSRVLQIPADEARNYRTNTHYFTFSTYDKAADAPEDPKPIEDARYGYTIADNPTAPDGYYIVLSGGVKGSGSKGKSKGKGKGKVDDCSPGTYEKEITLFQVRGTDRDSLFFINENNLLRVDQVSHIDYGSVTVNFKSGQPQKSTTYFGNGFDTQLARERVRAAGAQTQQPVAGQAQIGHPVAPVVASEWVWVSYMHNNAESNNVICIPTDHSGNAATAPVRVAKAAFEAAGLTVPAAGSGYFIKADPKLSTVRDLMQ